ncbi:MAG: Wzz/FepE/Etk N-terminal domain-containing protein [Firmicutes bacterium]|nr:Wzz/FepE/Etk N-terminal domain-containing protein [Bacillota bacterium]
MNDNNIINPMNSGDYIDLLELAKELRKKIVLIIVCAILGGAVMGVYSFFIATPIYQSTSKLYILSKTTSITSLADIQVGSSLASDYVELIKSRPVVLTVIKDMDLDMSYDAMVNNLIVENVSDTRLVKITVSDTDPERAKLIANKFAKVAKVQISNIMRTDEPTIAEAAVVKRTPVSPNKRKNILMGILIGIALSCGYVTIRFLMDDTIKDPDDVTKYLELDNLAIVPFEDGKKPGSTKKHKKHRNRKHKIQRRS